MKKTVLFGILISIILISGAGCEKQKEPLCNSPYFEYKTGECCLDQDSNKICDNDEKQEENKLYQPVQPVITESCTKSTHFQCTWSNINKEEVQIKLKLIGNGIGIIKKIDIPGISCSKEFNEITVERGKIFEAGVGIRYEEIQQFNLPCTFNKDFVDSDLIVKMDFYNAKTFKEGNTSNYWMGYEDKEDITETMRITGLVR